MNSLVSGLSVLHILGGVLHCKWGIDGSTGHSNYKQAGVPQDDQMLVTTVVPLQLEAEDSAVIWRNSTPGSTRFCRPMRLQMAKETAVVSQEELRRVDAEVSTLQPLSTPSAVVRYELMMTMVSRQVIGVKHLADLIYL